MNLFIVAAVLAVAAAAPSSYSKDAEIAIVAQSDVRNVDGSGAWSYAGSDGTTRDEAYAQKTFKGVTYDSYGKESYGDVQGNTNKGSSYWISPEGQKFTLTWVADEAGFAPKGDHLPVPPVHEYELPVAPVHVPFDGKGFKIY
ncbi:cuticle protein CP14.6-like isoform X3 [Daphnia carinata]|uniref:cuticle protein CP14.6-like isoform X3 n=1 Tax=Daphnia carinata TaxID=120202 RepID=UPI002868CDEE|nr:cuticle protein CP14.6-like isoform X3 [Daphnia carinata]